VNLTCRKVGRARALWSGCMMLVLGFCGGRKAEGHDGGWRRRSTSVAELAHQMCRGAGCFGERVFGERYPALGTATCLAMLDVHAEGAGKHSPTLLAWRSRLASPSKARNAPRE